MFEVFLRKKVLCIIGVVLCIILVAAFVLGWNPVHYHMAKAKLEDKKYVEAQALFEKIIDYKDASEQVLECKYMMAEASADAGQLDVALQLYLDIAEYKDASERVLACRYMMAEASANAGQLDVALQLYLDAAGYKDAVDKAEVIGAELLDQAIHKGAFEDALKMLDKLPEMSGRNEVMLYLNGRIKERARSVKEALQFYGQLDVNYRDVEERIDVYYKQAVDAEEVSFIQAIECYQILPQNFKDVSKRLARVAAYEKILGTYRCVDWSQTNTVFGDRSMEDTEYTFPLDVYSEFGKVVILVPDLLLDGKIKTIKGTISESNGAYTVTIPDDSGYEHTVEFSNHTLLTKSYISLKNEGESSGSLILDFLIDGWNEWVETTTIQKWVKE